jgi:hypothetical protein
MMGDENDVKKAGDAPSSKSVATAGTDAITPAATAAMPPAHPATLLQMVALSIYLLAWVVFLLLQLSNSIKGFTAESMAEVSTSWRMPAGVTLNNGPAAFIYDSVQQKLIHHGAITPERKLELRVLFTAASLENGTPLNDGSQIATKPPVVTAQAPVVQPANATVPAQAAAPAKPASASATEVETARREYNQAIDNLAYLANARQAQLISLLLWLGLLGGALGAILRSLVDFVGNACYTKNLDLVTWWPLYFTRPIVGGILGFVLVVMFKARLFAAGDAQPADESMWWLGMAVLGGFSTVDVTMRLRLAAKALFGVDSGKDSGKGAGKEPGKEPGKKT